LGRILQPAQPSLVHLLGDPALVADMRVTATLVERSENPLHLMRATARRGQPGALAVMGVEVSCGVLCAYLRQAGAPPLKPSQDISPGPERKLLPSGDHPLLEVGGVLGAAAWLHALPDRSVINATDRRRLAFGTIAVVRLVRAAA
jgi:hypothetical protein